MVEDSKYLLDLTSPSVSDWAEKNLILSPVSSAEPGPYSLSRTPYLRAVLEAVTDPQVSEIVLMTSAQIGKTTAIHAILGYYIHHEPSPIMVMFPTLDLGKNWSVTRFKPMVKDTPALRGLIDFRSGQESNTALRKTFPGGFMQVVGAGSPVMLSSQPIRILLCDEIDRYPPSAGVEGDPLELARKRTSTFASKKIVLAATPTVKDESRIEAAYEQSDRARYFVPCPNCNEFQILTWSQVRWPQGEPELAKYTCLYCEHQIEQFQKNLMVAEGEWRSERPAVKRIRGFHLSELYSPWVMWGETAVNFTRASTLPDKLKVWVNTSLAETWAEKAETVDWDFLANRREKYGAEVPAPVLMMTAGVDVQDDRLECSVYGWGLDEEGWVIDHKSFYGDPSASDVWDLLLDYLIRDFTQETREEKIRIQATFVDSGDRTEDVYRFCRANAGRYVYAIKGSPTHGKPILSRPTRAYKHGIKVYMLGTDTAKDLLFRRLRIADRGPGFIHFAQHLPDEFFAQITAERMTKKMTRGYTRRYYVKLRNRNEALDCYVYAYAAMVLVNPDFEGLRRKRSSSSMHALQEAQDSVIHKVPYVSNPRPRLSKKRSTGWMKKGYGGFG